MAIAAILLAAGYATRLYPLTQERPKTLLPIGRGVILDEVLRRVETVPDVARRILVTNHRFADQFFAWQRGAGVTVDIVDDGTSTVETRLGAIRDLQLAQQSVDPGDDLLVVGTDNLFRWSLAEFVASAKRYRPNPVIALWHAPSSASATQFGVVTRDPQSRIIAFAEKSADPPSAEVALCVYYFPASVRADIQRFLAERHNADAPGYFIQWLVGRGAVYGVMMPGAWYDIGTREAYEQVLTEWSEGGRP